MIATKTGRYTAKDYAALPEGSQYQLIDYQLVMSPSPNSPHQYILEDLFRVFDRHIGAKGLGEVHFSALDVHFGEGDVFQPDLFVILNGNPGQMELEGFQGAPDIVIEVLSLSTKARDLGYKKSVYESTGVREYWIVDPTARSIECLHNATAGFQRHSFSQHNGSVSSSIVEGFSVKLSDVFTDKLSRI